MTPRFASGWENPDHHPDLNERPRPMYDGDGRPVTQAPPPDPAPELDRMGLHGEPVDQVVRPGDAPETMVMSTTAGTGATNPDRAQAIRSLLSRGGPVGPGAGVHLLAGEKVQPLDHARQLAAIRKVAQDALDSDKPARWAAALDKIQELAE